MSDTNDRKSEQDLEREERDGSRTADKSSDAIAPNPPRTLTGDKFAAPKFGSAGGGGAELEPGPERD
jgi:hypothetical protein